MSTISVKKTLEELTSLPGEDLDKISKNLFEYSNYDDLRNAGKITDEPKEAYAERVLESLDYILDKKACYVLDLIELFFNGKTLEEIKELLD